MIIEEFIINYLSEKLDTSTYAEKPEDYVEKMLIVERIAQYQENHINYATVVVWSYFDTMLHTAQLAEDVQDAMKEIIDNDEIFHCSLENSFSDNETDDKRYRYRSEFDIVF